MRTPRPMPADSERLPSSFLRDLSTLLADDLALYLSLEEKGAVFSVKSQEVQAFGESLLSRWSTLTPAERARKVVDWIHEAARYSRSPRIRWAPPA